MDINYPIFKFRNHYSPTNGVEVIEIGEYLCLSMTCGGGMGGCRWKEYIKATELKPNTLVEVETLFGEKKTINTEYVVKAETKKYIVVKEDSTPWVNFHNKRYDSHISYTWYSMERNRQHELLMPHDSFDGNSVKDNTIATSVYVNGKCTSFSTY